jgi:hypothetical protein
VDEEESHQALSEEIGLYQQDEEDKGKDLDQNQLIIIGNPQQQQDSEYLSDLEIEHEEIEELHPTES